LKIKKILPIILAVVYSLWLFLFGGSNGMRSDARNVDGCRFV
jgi:hypothetical protein